MSVTAVYRDATLRMVRDLLADLASPLALEVVSCLDAGDHKRLVGLTADPALPSFRDDYLAVEILSKYPFLDLGIDRERVAIEKFVEVEDRLRFSDRNLRACWSKLGQTQPDVHWVFHSMRRKIQYLLGDFSWERCEPYFGFGPGATVSIPRRRAHAPNKFGNFKPTVTQNCLDLGLAVLNSNPTWADHLRIHNGEDPNNWVKLVAGNKVVTVPKTA